MELRAYIFVALTFLAVNSLLMASGASLQQNISCADPPFDYNAKSERTFLKDSKLEKPEECRNYADCDPYGFSMCSEHKKWAKKCCALYCNFCH